MNLTGAVFDDSPTQGRILFWRVDGTLIAANSGRAFTKKGLRSICYPSLSSKTAETAADDAPFASPHEAKERIELIRRRCRELAQLDPDRVESIRAGVSAVARDYRQRILLELLQNAADANRKRPIGSKGQGFRSILNITDAPRIHSDHLHARWSPDIVHQLLGESGELSALDVPEWFPPESESSPPVRSLLASDEYQTVIVLPLEASGDTALRKEWDAIANDPSLLVFIDGIESIKWRDEAGEIEWCRKREGEVVEITRVQSGNSSPPKLWRVTEDNAAAIAFHVNEAGELCDLPPDTDRKLRCFFATGETNPFQRFLVHGDFQLSNDRKRIESAGEQTDAAVVSVAASVARSLEGCVSVGIALDLLDVALPDRTDESAIETVLFRAVRNSVVKHPLPIAIGGRSLGDVHCCPKDDDLPFFCRGAAGVEAWERLKNVLASKRPGGIANLPLLPCDVENLPRIKTLIRYNPTAPISSSAFRGLSWAVADGGASVVDSASAPLFMTPQGPTPELAPGIRVRWIDADFTNALREAFGTSADQWFESVLAVHRFRFANFLSLAIVPSLKAEAWSSEISHFIFKIWTTYALSGDRRFDLRDANRVEFSERFKVRCRDGSEHAAAEVYAGREWTGDGFLEREFAGRQFLDAPPADEDERKMQEGFHRWCGVAWAPRVIPILLHPTTAKTRLGWLWDGVRFVCIDGSRLPESWDAYCKSERVGGERERACDMHQRKARLRVNWTLDGGVELLRKHGAAAVIEREWAGFSRYLDATFYQSGRLDNSDRDDQSRTCESHLSWLLRTTAWVPSADGDLRQPADIFQIGEVTNALEEWLAKPLHPLNTGMASALRIRAMWSEVARADWQRWLNDAADRRDLTIDDHKAIRRLYQTTLEHTSVADGQPPPFAGQKVWAVERTSDDEVWQLRDCAKTFFVDQPHLDSLRLKGLWLFPVRLLRLEAKAERVFGIKRLSAVLRASVMEDHAAYPCRMMDDQLRDRREWLLAYLGLADPEDRRKEMDHALDSVRVFVAKAVRLNFAINGVQLGMWPLQRYPLKTGDKWCLYLAEDELKADDRWRWFGEVILFAAGFKTADKAADVRDILMCREDRLESRLLELNVPPEAISDAKSRRNQDRQKRPPAEPPPSPHTSPENPQTNAEGSGVAPPPAGTEAGDKTRAQPANEPERDVPKELPPGRVRSETRPHPHRGFEAQEWLRDEFRRHLGPAWQVSQTEEASDDSGRTDIIATAPDGTQHHIEVKRIKGRVIHWSEKQIGNARLIGRRYCIATVEPTEGDPIVRWVFNPLSQFLVLDRRVRWTWSESRTDEAPDANWNVHADRKVKPADSYRVKIPLTDDFLSSLPVGVGKFLRSC